jgi:hypothetical protein
MLERLRHADEPLAKPDLTSANKTRGTGIIAA